jgi:hypothetical protein
MAAAPSVAAVASAAAASASAAAAAEALAAVEAEAAARAEAEAAAQAAAAGGSPRERLLLQMPGAGVQGASQPGSAGSSPRGGSALGSPRDLRRAVSLAAALSQQLPVGAAGGAEPQLPCISPRGCTSPRHLLGSTSFSKLVAEQRLAQHGLTSPRLFSPRSQQLPAAFSAPPAEPGSGQPSAPAVAPPPDSQEDALAPAPATSAAPPGPAFRPSQLLAAVASARRSSGTAAATWRSAAGGARRKGPGGELPEDAVMSLEQFCKAAQKLACLKFTGVSGQPWAGSPASAAGPFCAARQALRRSSRS